MYFYVIKYFWGIKKFAAAKKKRMKHGVLKDEGVTAQDSCDMRDRLLRYFATCGQEKPLSGSLKRGEKNA